MSSITTRSLVRSAMVLVVVSAAIAWFAAGDVGGGSAAGVRATDTALAHAATLADETLVLATQLQQSLDTLSSGMGSTAEAMDHTIEISKNVRSLIDTLTQAGVAPSAALSDIGENLAHAEESLLEVQGGMSETHDNLLATAPALTDAVSRLHTVPGALRSAQDSAHAAVERLDRGVVLWRLAIVTGAAALLLVLVLFGRLDQRVDDRRSDQP